MEVRVKDEPIYDSLSIAERKVQSIKVKEEPNDIEMQTSKIEVKAEEKFSATEEFTNKSSIQTTSIAFLNEETTEETNKATTSKTQQQNKKTNKLENSK